MSRSPVIAMRTLFRFLGIFFIFSTNVFAVCPEWPATLCEMVQKSDWVVRGRVESIQLVKDSDDPEGIAGWLYHLNVITTYRGTAKPSLIVFSSNTTSRIVLNQDGDYFVFISKASGELLETGNECDNYSESKYNLTLENQILKCVSNSK